MTWWKRGCAHLCCSTWQRPSASGVSWPSSACTASCSDCSARNTGRSSFAPKPVACSMLGAQYCSAAEAAPGAPPRQRPQRSTARARQRAAEATSDAGGAAHASQRSETSTRKCASMPTCSCRPRCVLYMVGQRRRCSVHSRKSRRVGMARCMRSAVHTWSGLELGSGLGLGLGLELGLGSRLGLQAPCSRRAPHAGWRCRRGARRQK
eukprot:scaffold23750_cov70-Phaeocystis_antarctica.AAC.2